MAELTYREAVADAIAQEMERDDKVVFLGEDIAKAGGVFKTTVGLYDKFGPDRVRDTPISEQAILGAAMGAAMTGLRPIAEIMFSDFFAVCWDIVVNQIAKTRYMTGGQVTHAPGHPKRQRRRRPVRGTALPIHRELGDDDSGAQGRCAVDPGRRQGTAGGVDPRPRPGDFLRTEVSLRRQGRNSRRRARGRTRHREGGADGTTRSSTRWPPWCRGRSRPRKSSRRSSASRHRWSMSEAWCRWILEPSSPSSRNPAALSPSRKIRAFAAGRRNIVPDYRGVLLGYGPARDPDHDAAYPVGVRRQSRGSDDPVGGPYL